MFLKSLTLKGFKSFADSTTLEFEPGITVVVGPNGSGKSNVVDAVAWVLGAQGPRTVRSSKMEDVIFAGTAKRPALGRAEVSLTIDNSSGLLPIEFSEVTVTRTLFRNGDSEYAINGVPCRLLDVQELLSDSGVGRQQHVIVSQGQLDAVLNARPEERRLIIEEAAGVLKYRRRRERAQRRLESTEGNLLRLQDLLREVRRQLRPLERQAADARRHGSLVAELSALRLHLAGREISSLQNRLTTAVGARQDIDRQEQDLRAELRRLDSEVLTAEAELGPTGGHEIDDLSDAVGRLEGLRERARGLAALLAERRRSIERDLRASVDEGVVASLESDAARLAADLEQVETAALQLAPQADELAEAEGALARERGEFEARWGGDRDAPAGVGEAAEIRGELAALRQSVPQARAEVERLRSSLTALEAKERSLALDAERLRIEIKAAEEAKGRLGAQVEAAEAARVAAGAGLADAESAWQQAEADRHRWSARAEALALALDQARARAGAELLAEVDGVAGTLLELVEVDAGWEPAFEAAAGEALAAVVVDHVPAAREALRHLRMRDASGAVLAMDGRPVPASLDLAAAQAAHAAGAEPVRAHVRAARPGVDALLDGLLGHAVAVEGGWEAALDVALAHPGLIVVTRDGDRFGPGGWRTGGDGAGVTGAALEEARVRAEEAVAAATRAGALVVAARRELDQCRRAEGGAVEAFDANRAGLGDRSAALERAESAGRDVIVEAETQRIHLGEQSARLERDEARVAELEAALPALEAAEARAADQAAAMRAARDRLEQRTAAVAVLRTDLEVRAAGLEERRTLLDRRLAEVEDRLRDKVEQRAQAAGRRQHLEAIALATDRLSSLVDGRTGLIETSLAALRERRRKAQDAARARTERLEELRRSRQGAERRLSELRERANRAELDQAEVRMRLEAAVEVLRRDFDCEPDAAKEAECPELPEGTSAPARARELERELRLMGPINPLALEEFTALQERNQFLEGQLEDVKAGRRELAKVIRAIDTEIVEVFASAYADVSGNFEQLFATLFPGGAGQLRLTDPDNLLETGIEVEARPSGKNVRKLSLLSGGERSLTALAYLFAVFRSRPSPFYLMDEVEAALDDLNLHRFLDLIHEFRAEAQLLIVSHQKRTMEAADCLYGVTMQPGGSSRVVSEKVAAGA